ESRQDHEAGIASEVVRRPSLDVEVPRGNEVGIRGQHDAADTDRIGRVHTARGRHLDGACRIELRDTSYEGAIDQDAVGERHASCGADQYLAARAAEADALRVDLAADRHVAVGADVEGAGLAGRRQVD